MNDPFWSVDVPRALVTELQRDLRERDLMARAARATGSGPMMEFLVDNYGALTITVRSDEHPPPHFHVRCGRAEASFRLSDGGMIAGNLKREARNIQRWYLRNRARVIDAWNVSRPSDCPVGVYVESRGV